MKAAPEITPTERVKAIRAAARAFANDYGPLSQANQGDEAAQHEVGRRMFRACADAGLKIIIDPDK